MKKLNPIGYLLLVFCLSTCQLINLSTVLYGQVGIGVSFTPDFSPSKEEKEIKKTKNPFLVELAERFSLEEKDLDRLYSRGYGYTEIIKLILITKKTNEPLEEIVKKRDKGKKMRKIAEDYELDYWVIDKEALKIKEEIKTSLLSQPTTQILLPKTTEENLLK